MKHVFECCQNLHGSIRYSRELEDNDHWSIREIYPLEYYGKEYDPETDYYKEIMMMDNPTKIQGKINTRKRNIENHRGRIGIYQAYINKELLAVKKLEAEIEKMQLIIEINTIYKNQANNKE